MRVLVLYAHPLPKSFHASLHRLVVETLREHGHEVDDCDLYAEGFDPVLSAEERSGYHEVPQNRLPVAGYVERLMRAEALVLCFPTWTFGAPAILKGFFDRVLIPGVAFHLNGHRPVRPGLTHIRRIAVVTTYGRPRHDRALGRRSAASPGHALPALAYRNAGSGALSRAVPHERRDAGAARALPAPSQRHDGCAMTNGARA